MAGARPSSLVGRRCRPADQVTVVVPSEFLAAVQVTFTATPRLSFSEKSRFPAEYVIVPALTAIHVPTLIGDAGTLIATALAGFGRVVFGIVRPLPAAFTVTVFASVA